jgi:predicted TIM-barrel fold metal-dependent hydrolase
MSKRVHDCLINVHFGDEAQAEWMQRVRKEYFKQGDGIFDKWDIEKVIDEMDAQGVEKCIVMGQIGKPGGSPFKFIQQRPDRFAMSLGGGNLLQPMKNIREIEAIIKNNPVAYLLVGPSFWADGTYAPDHAVYYPLYTKCVEWDIPLCLNTGLPGPPIPGEVQNPIHLDRVCHHFPDLKLCMAHGADPWWDIAIRLMVKYPNLHLMTSAWAPKYLPESLLHYMRTRGKTKIIFASDAPVLSITRTTTEARALDLPEEVMDNWLYANAQRFFFARLEQA